MKTVIFQGLPGSFSHTAAAKFFGTDFENREAERFVDLFTAVAQGSADYGVVPIENTLAGSVYENYDHLATYDVHVIGEYILKVEHNLLALPGVSLNEIHRVMSHPKALEQCVRFFASHKKIEEIAVFDTAGAAQRVAEEGDRHAAAIASDAAASLYGLDVIKRNLEDDSNNYTRFFIIAKNESTQMKPDKCSIIFSVSHKPGSLFKAIQTFDDFKLNMTKIESRPIKGKPFEYFFNVDFVFDPERIEEAKTAMEALRSHTHILKILGWYHKHER